MIPLTEEQRKYIIPIFEDQVKQGILGEVTEDVESLDYVSNMFLKTEEDKLRPCINYQKLNKGTVKTEMPIPNKETMLAKLAGADAYITMDAKAAYNQLPVAESSQKYMVFVVPGVDGRPRYFYPKRSNFGSSNMPGEFQRLTESFFEGPKAADAVYIDDLTIKCYKDKDELTLEKLRNVLIRAREKGMIFAFKKTHFVIDDKKILGEILNKYGRRANPARVQALREWPVPTTRRKLRAFLGLYNFLAPLKRHGTTPELVKLQSFTKTKRRFKPEEIAEPFEAMKKTLCRWILLHAYDPSRETFVMTDSSASGMGAIVMQMTPYGLRAIAVFSKKWPLRKKEYAAHTKEGMALVMAMKRFEHMLKQTNVTAITDSENVVDLLTNSNWDQVPAMWLRWRRYLSQTFSISLLHVPGKTNLAADALSRQTYEVASTWHSAETFFSPLLRNIYDLQQADERIQEIMEQVRIDATKPQPKKMPKMYYFIENGLLKQMHHRFGKQIVIPKAAVSTILYLEHDVPLKGHPGEAYMRLGIKQNYWWEGIDEDVRKYVKSCRGCQLSKARLTRTEITSAMRQASSIFSIFSMDLIDMNTISASYRYILVIMDYYSSFVILTNLRNKKATSILRALWDCITLFGPPETLLTDRGKEFVNKLAQRFSEESGIQHILTYAYRPQANGKNERSHAVIQNALRIFAETHPDTWHKYTKSMQYSFNTRPNIDTTIPPYEILLGRQTRPLHNTSPFLEYDRQEMHSMRKHIDNVVRAHQLKKLHARAMPPPPPLNVGDKVILNREFPRRPKRLFPAMGPYEITAQVGKSGYNLKHLETGETKTNVSRAHLFSFTERGKSETEGKEEAHDKTEEKDEDEENEGEEEDEFEAEIGEKIEEEEVEQTIQDSTEEEKQPVKKKPRLLKQLESFNDPAQKTTIVEDLAAGNMAIIKQGNKARIGEIVEVKEDSVKLHWYGSTTTKDLARYRWKFYPGWENDDGEVEYRKSQAGGKPAKCEVLKSEIYKTFTRLTLQSTLPSDVVKLIQSLTL